MTKQENCQNPHPHDCFGDNHSELFGRSRQSKSCCGFVVMLVASCALIGCNDTNPLELSSSALTTYICDKDIKQIPIEIVAQNNTDADMRVSVAELGCACQSIDLKDSRIAAGDEIRFQMYVATPNRSKTLRPSILLAGDLEYGEKIESLWFRDLVFVQKAEIDNNAAVIEFQSEERITVIREYTESYGSDTAPIPSNPDVWDLPERIALLDDIKFVKAERKDGISVFSWKAQFAFYAPKDNSWSGRIRIGRKEDQKRQVRMSIHLTRRIGLQVSPEAIDFGVVQSQAAVRRIVFRAQDGIPFSLKRVWSNSPALKVSGELPASSLTSHCIKLVCHPFGESTGKHSTEIVAETTHPQFSSVTLPVTYEYR